MIIQFVTYQIMVMENLKESLDALLVSIVTKYFKYIRGGKINENCNFSRRKKYG